MKKAFEYDFRGWTIPEVTEAMTLAGFQRAEVFLSENNLETGESSEYERVVKGKQVQEEMESWNAYVVAVKQVKVDKQHE